MSYWEDKRKAEEDKAKSRRHLYLVIVVILALIGVGFVVYEVGTGYNNLMNTHNHLNCLQEGRLSGICDALYPEN